MAFSFDGVLLKIKLDTVGNFDAANDFYGDWKEWQLQSDNIKFPPAFDTTGGDDIGGGQTIAPYFFLRNDNGWVIEGPEESGEIVITGNLFPRDPTLPAFKEPNGNFTILFRQIVSPQALAVTGTGSNIAAQDIRDAMKLPHTDGDASIDTKLNNNFAVSAASL